MQPPERRSATLITTRNLILMRHAKSGYPAGVRDHDRPLAPRGRREGAFAGDWLRHHLPPVDSVLSSTSARTRETLDVSQVRAPVRLAAEIYDATPGAILEQIQQTDSAVAALLVIGHSPGIPELAMELSGHGSAEEPFGQLRSRFPTAAVAVFEIGLSWADLEFGTGRLTDFHIPRT
jgi:phosphohistidine phosphatase